MILIIFESCLVLQSLLLVDEGLELLQGFLQLGVLRPGAGEALVQLAVFLEYLLLKCNRLCLLLNLKDFVDLEMVLLIQHQVLAFFRISSDHGSSLLLFEKKLRLRP